MKHIDYHLHSVRRIFFSIIAVGFLILGAFSATASVAFAQEKPSTSRPNFVFFLVDDMGWTDPHCYGNSFHETPNTDRLATQGMRFTDAYAACPVCSPTRASIMSGKYPATLNLTDFIPGHWRPWEKLVVPKMNLKLPLEEQTIAEVLKPAGYVSGSFGKWHLGGSENFPNHQGFDEYVVTGGRHFAPTFRTTPNQEIESGTYLGDFLTTRSEKFIEDNRDKPFFLYLSHYAVHIPLEAKMQLIKKYVQKHPKPKDRINNPIYAAMVEHIDQSLGRIMRKLDELKLTENTVLIFFSDNGGLFKRYDGQGTEVMVNTPLRAEKGTMYEGGIREPLIVRWPAVVEAGSECHVPVCSVDFLPTIAHIAGASDQIPDDVDGVNLLPILKQTGQLKRDALYWHYPHYHHTAPVGAIRQGDFKLIEYFEDGRLELYNLKQDIGEKNDLSQKMAEKASTMQMKLANWRKAVGARMPTKNPDYDAEKAHLWKRRPRPQSKSTKSTKK